MRIHVKQKTRATVDTVTNRDRAATALPILIKATAEQFKAGKYDGVANFFGRFDQPVIAIGPEHWNDAGRLIAAMQLRDGYEKRDDLLIAKAIEKLYSPQLAEILKLPSGDIFPPRALKLKRPSKTGRELVAQIAGAWKLGEPKANFDLKRAAEWWLPKEITRHMKRAKFVLWWNWKRKRFQPAIFCPDVRTAQYVRAALDQARVCPNDDRPFIPEREDQEYCSIRCRETFRQRRRRSKIKISGGQK